MIKAEREWGRSRKLPCQQPIPKWHQAGKWSTPAGLALEEVLEAPAQQQGCLGICIMAEPFRFSCMCCVVNGKAQTFQHRERGQGMAVDMRVLRKQKDAMALHGCDGLFNGTVALTLPIQFPRALGPCCLSSSPMGAGPFRWGKSKVHIAV